LQSLIQYIQVVQDFFHQQHLPSHMDILDIYLKFREVENVDLVGGFNPSEKYSSNWISSPNRGENKRYLKNHHLEMFHQLLLD